MNAPSPSTASEATTAAPGPGLAGGFRQIYRHMSQSRRSQFYLVLALMVAGAIVEFATIGAVVPFLSLLAGSGSKLPVASGLFDALGTGGREGLIVSGVLFASVAIASGLIRLALARSTQDFAYRLAHELMVGVERRILLQPYSFHVRRNSSTLIAGLEKAELVVFELVLPLMQAMTAIVLAAFIMAALLWLDPVIATVTALAFAAVYSLVTALTRRRLARNSAVLARGFDHRLKIAQESIGGIRDVIIDDSHALYVDQFERANFELSQARSATSFMAVAPRFIVETVGMLIIAAIAAGLAYREGSLAGAVPVLGAIALGGQRLLPLLQQIHSGWSTAAGNRSLLDQTLEFLDLPCADGSGAAAKPVPFKERITFDKVAITFPGRRRAALQDISLDIPHGSSLAIVGETGSGKSTLADLLMGLLQPDEGRICIDHVPLTKQNLRGWQRNIAHVPQSIFLPDASIVRNIALSAHNEKIDLGRVREAAAIAQLDEFIDSLTDGYETIVGERGVRLSGGQRQRLGIARAIYKQSPVLVLDEATSALDEATEAAVMDGLHRLGEGRTVIVIAHRLSTIARCDQVARLHGGRIVASGRFADVIDQRK